jgi:hypothetical protein
MFWGKKFRELSFAARDSCFGKSRNDLHNWSDKAFTTAEQLFLRIYFRWTSWCGKEVGPFHFNLNSINDDELTKDYLIELWASGWIRMGFETGMLENFWYAQLAPFPVLETLMAFMTTHLCEVGLSSLLHIKKNARICLNANVWLFKRKFISRTSSNKSSSRRDTEPVNTIQVCNSSCISLIWN